MLYVISSLHTNLSPKSLNLNQTKTNKLDSQTIDSMLMSDINLKFYPGTFYRNKELKPLTRYRFDKVKKHAKLKSSVPRLICILFPELKKLIPQLHMASVYTMLSEFPRAKQVATAHLTRLTNLLSGSPKGRYGKNNYYIQKCCKNLNRFKHASKIIGIIKYYQIHSETYI